MKSTNRNQKKGRFSLTRRVKKRVCRTKDVSMYEMWTRKQIHENAWKKHRTKNLIKKSGQWRRRHLGGHDLVRRMDGQGEVMIWRRKCSGYSRQK